LLSFCYVLVLALNDLVTIESQRVDNNSSIF
jgi:hypothetical protein